tara:strand:- start:452 stop:562 length:111 start_codon:yes stop_codon:yes gene_type:complete
MNPLTNNLKAQKTFKQKDWDHFRIEGRGYTYDLGFI